MKEICDITTHSYSLEIIVIDIHVILDEILYATSFYFLRHSKVLRYRSHGWHFHKSEDTSPNGTISTEINE